jgi:hypothetical protein
LTHSPRVPFVGGSDFLFFLIQRIHSLGLDEEMLMSFISVADAGTLTSKNSHRPTTFGNGALFSPKVNVNSTSRSLTLTESLKTPFCPDRLDQDASAR